MSGFRDARLHKALASAPDAQLRPAARTRQAIQARARDAIAPSGEAAWWRKFWAGAGALHSPWNAAFATLALATLVTVLWYEREIPGARPETAQSDQPAPAAPLQPAASASDEAPAAAAPPPVRTAPAPAPQQARKAAPAVSQAGPVPERRKPLAADAARERNVDSASAALRDQDERASAKSTRQRADAARQAETASVAPPPPPATLPSPPDAALSGPAAPAAAPAPPGAAPSAAPAAAPRAAAPATGLASQSSPIDGATQLRIASGARSVAAPLEHPSRLADLMSRVARDAHSPEPLEAPVDLRVELRRQGELAGVMELAGSQARWTSLRAGESHSATARPDAALLQALREEFNRLLER
ncbi:MAG TPA: hypothetical protein VN649_21285 [Ramlibacter sp.]|nr:hypothetical protein [Ramlibacter sp.]